MRVYFVSGTVHPSVEHGDDNVEERPPYPTFKEIGEWFGEFDLVASPCAACLCFIGSFPFSVNEPRWITSTIYCALQDSVHIPKARAATHWW